VYEKFAQFMRTLKVGDIVRLTLYHDGTTRQVEFKLPERPILPGDVPSDSRRALAALVIISFIPVRILGDCVGSAYALRDEGIASHVFRAGWSLHRILAR
jgi:hypothetical protein